MTTTCENSLKKRIEVHQTLRCPVKKIFERKPTRYFSRKPSKKLLKMSDFEINSLCQNNIRGCLRNELRWSGKGGVRRNWKNTGCLIPL